MKKLAVTSSIFLCFFCQAMSLFQSKTPPASSQPPQATSSSSSLPASSSSGSSSTAVPTAENLSACLTNISTTKPVHGSPPIEWLQFLIKWARYAPDSVFAANNNPDVYWLLAPRLGPYTDLKTRRAVMIEALTVMAAYESEWDWAAGVDTSNSTSTGSACAARETGAFQSSYDSMPASMGLKTLFIADCQGVLGADDCHKWRTCTWGNRIFQTEYTADFIRIQINGYGTLLNHNYVYAHVRPACVAQLKGVL